MRHAPLLSTCGTLATAASPTERAASRAGVRALTLANGLRVIVWPTRQIPNVALHNWVRAGSRNETRGLTGLAHFFEHMMFNGTARHGPGEFDRLMEAAGGASNAFTTGDVTVYQDWFPRTALGRVFELEADRIANLSFVPEIIESERRVVRSERRLCVDDNNAGLLSERVQAAAFAVHPYRFPTIGLPADIAAWRLADLRRFFRAYYAPNNQTFILAGDVAPEDAFALARAHLARIPRREGPPAVCIREPEQLLERSVILRRKGRTPLLQYAYKAPAADDPRGPAVRLLMTTLVEGDASRLHRHLVEERKLAVEVAGEWHEGFDPGLFWLHLTLPEGTQPGAVRAALDAELASVVERGVTPAELQRAKSVLAGAYFRQLATLDGKAHLLGEYEVLRRGWRELFEAPARYAAVSRAEVQATARAVLEPRRRTVGVLIPTEPRRAT
ncbi:MAG TPA: pitrilysin family protein [Steroidobacteraceae bacterium]|nr:pitrilysin family protein [Steroidobacteraceae bacterium]